MSTVVAQKRTPVHRFVTSCSLSGFKLTSCLCCSFECVGSALHTITVQASKHQSMFVQACWQDLCTVTHIEWAAASDRCRVAGLAWSPKAQHRCIAYLIDIRCKVQPAEHADRDSTRMKSIEMFVSCQQVAQCNAVSERRVLMSLHDDVAYDVSLGMSSLTKRCAALSQIVPD